MWTADKYIHSTDPKDGSAVVKGGGGEAILDCRGGWHLFNGNVEHETQPVKPLPGRKDYTRVSVIGAILKVTLSSGGSIWMLSRRYSLTPPPLSHF